MKKLVTAFMLVLVLVVLVFGSVAPAFADTPPGLKGYEGHPGNQGGGGNNGQPNGLLGYEGQPGNQGG